MAASPVQVKSTAESPRLTPKLRPFRVRAEPMAPDSEDRDSMMGPSEVEPPPEGEVGNRARLMNIVAFDLPDGVTTRTRDESA